MVLLVLYLSWLLEGPIKQRRAFLVDRDRWAIVSAPLVLSVDLTNNAMLDRIWPIVANREAVAVNQHWSGSPGQLLLTEQGSYPSPLSKKGFYAYPAVLGQSRGWQNVPGMTGPAPWQHGPCKDEWTGGPCVHHYMTLGGGPKNMTVDAADDWCNANSSCYGFTYKTGADKTGSVTPIYFRDETQIFFMDSEIKDLAKELGSLHPWTSHVKQARAAPLSPATSGLQIWIKDVSGSATFVGEGSDSSAALAVLLVNLGQSALESYTLPLSKLPSYFKHGGGSVRVRDVWHHKTLPDIAAGGYEFQNIGLHDSAFLVLS